MSTFTGFHTNSRFGFFPSKGSLFIMHCNVVTKYTIARGVFEYKGICPGLIRAMNVSICFGTTTIFLMHYFRNHYM